MIDNELKVDVMRTLSVFHCILDHGEKLGDGHYIYSGIQAKHDQEGYTLTLLDSQVKLNLFFHNKFQADFAKRTQFDEFLHKLDRIYNKHH
ncbi:DUF3081 family protein [Neptuniibacter sp.]|uniref:DUF3081 family protein n=1 Tax=Neptuniibacter sp. TaxID=1962643 RepID=UPI002631E4FE|nr:DUF3081 family protein [Neptuniibacter sp.]MCP4598575.1 DUF3081 domain-containing protein [Neptuniibacter sp.]